MARSVDGVAAIHERFAQQLTDNLGVPDERVTVIRNWSHLASTEPIAKEAARRKIWGGLPAR